MSESGPFGERVKALRLVRGWSQGELAERAGISRTGVSAIEGQRLVPAVTAALALARALDVTVEELFGSGPAFAPVEWAWPPRRDGARYWLAEVRGRVLAYPAEPTPCGELPADGAATASAPPPRGEADPRQTLVVAGCDPAAGLLAAEYHRAGRCRLIPLLRSSRQALELLKTGLVHVAGLHLAPTDEADGHRTLIQQELGPGFRLLRLAEWEEGVTYTPRGGRVSLRSLLKDGVRWVGREPGSGARRCLDALLGPAARLRRVALDHRGVADAVRCGWGDAGICLRLTSEAAGLDFLSLQWESYDLCYAAEFEDDPRLRTLVNVLRDARFQRELGSLPGYDVRHIARQASV